MMVGDYTQKLFLISIAALLFSQVGLSQTEKLYPKHQIELRHDNDFFVFTDRYYTTGSFIKYTTLLNNGFTASGKEHLSFQFVQQYYTPANILSADIADFDRPYVGFIGLETAWSAAYKTHYVGFSVLAGMAGPASGAEEFQGLFHSSGGIDTPPWVGQIENSFHVNLVTTYKKEWKMSSKPWSVYLGLQPTLAIGTKDTFLQQEGILYFGKRNALNNSIANNQLGTVKRELYFASSVAYRHVIYNALLEGHPIADNSELLIDSVNNMLLIRFDIVYRSGRNSYKIIQNYTSREAKRTYSHITYGLSVARSF